MSKKGHGQSDPVGSPESLTKDIEHPALARQVGDDLSVLHRGPGYRFYWNAQPSGRASDLFDGVVCADDIDTDVFFVTLQKTEEEYSPQTLYRDYPISERLFHWESQHTTSEESPTGERYIHHRALGTNVLLFVRQQKKVNGFTQPYLFMGPADYVRHESDRPMQIVWALREPMPAWFYQEAKLAAG